MERRLPTHTTPNMPLPPLPPKRTMTWPSVRSDQTSVSTSSHSLATSPPGPVTYLTPSDISADSDKLVLSSSPSTMSTVERQTSWQPSNSTWRYDRNPYHAYDEDDEDDSDSESDDDGEGDGWSPGITDFALFAADRRAAADRQEALPDRWDGLVERQRDALRRSVARSRSSSDVDCNSTNATPTDSPLMQDLDADQDDVCSEDDSRDLGGVANHDGHIEFSEMEDVSDSAIDDGDAESFEYDEQYEDDDEDADDGEVPVAVLLERAHRRRLKMTRPGLRFARTLSGRSHVWRRPSGQIYTVGEEDEATAA